MMKLAARQREFFMLRKIIVVHENVHCWFFGSADLELVAYVQAVVTEGAPTEAKD